MPKVKLILFFSVTFFVSCGTYKPKYLNEEDKNIHINPYESEVEKRFYLIGDAGLGASQNGALRVFEQFVEGKDTQDDYLIYLGDNIYPSGLPAKGEKGREDAVTQLRAQTDVSRFFDGKVLFIPGNHDWYTDGVKGLKRQEKYVEDALGDEDAFQPENGCPIEDFEITDNVALLTIDTQWYLTRWDKHPTINDECDIKTREAFFLELEDKLKDYSEKSIVIAMHHPAFTYGLHGGYFNFQKHIFASSNRIPLPFLASLVTLVRSQGGVSPQDRYNNRYNQLMKRIITMTRDRERVTVVSGHEHVLQYIENKGIKQVVSGSGSKHSPVALGEGSQFAYGGEGFAILEILKDGSTIVHYYNSKDGKPERMFSKEVHEPFREFNIDTLPNTFPKTVKASVYPKTETDRSDSYEWFWGDHYRDLYGTEVEVPVATLDTLMGGMKIIRQGGGHQTRSLRLNDAEGRTYNLRALKKSAVQFLQTTAFKDTYVEEDFRETVTEDVIMDFYTSSHPYGAYAIPKLSDAVGVFHTNPLLYFIPKQKALGKYNADYGDELYMLEERPDDTFLDVPSFGTPDAIESTSNVLEDIRDDEEYRIDEESYIKARLFDMLIGDWDRHQDQWRWARYDDKEKNTKTYKPIPRDRDQVFSNYDGALLGILNVMMPPSKQFQEYDKALNDVKWINLAGIKLDRTLIQNSGRETWLKQAEYIKNNLSDEAIDAAFKDLPKEVQGESSEAIKEKLRGRRDNMIDIANRYYDFLSKLVIVTATDKDDQIEVTTEGVITTITVSRIIDGIAEKPFKTKVVKHVETKEVWVYALDDDDEIIVNGNGKNTPKIRIIGGQNNDIYTVNGGKRVKLYDHKTKPNTMNSKGRAAVRFVDNYKFNNYRYDKFNNDASITLPSVGFNPDDGILVGISHTLTRSGFTGEKYQSSHAFSGGYFFATQGFKINYKGEFSNLLNHWKLLGGAQWTSENYTQNFFGLGNETVNRDDELGLDYNRVRTGSQSLKFGIVKNGVYGSRMELTGDFESIDVQETEGRFINEYLSRQNLEEDRKNFASVNGHYSYSGYDNSVNPTRGMFFNLKGGVKSNVQDFERTFAYLHYSLEFYNALTRGRKLVLNTKVQGKVNFGDQFEFYQAATLGTNSGLRGFRQERFSGESTLAFKTDLRYHLAKFKTGLLPLKLGIFAGGDVGRVWLDGENSERWHNDYGGGFWLGAVDSLSGEFRLFNSVEGLRFSFTFGVAF